MVLDHQPRPICLPIEQADDSVNGVDRELEDRRLGGGGALEARGLPLQAPNALLERAELLVHPLLL